MILESEGAGALGKFLNTTVYEGNIAYKTQFSNINPSDQELSSIDTTNSRIISLPITLEDGGGLLKTGDTVDLVYTAGGSAELSLLDSNGFNINNGEEGQNPMNDMTGQATSFSYAWTFLSDLVVYDVLTTDGYKYISKEGRYNGDSVSTVVVEDSLTADAGQIGYVLLVVTPEQFEQIKVRSSTGKISIAKRFENSVTHETLGYVIGDYGKIFAGEANAETGSLQVISTTSDSDRSNITTITTSNGSSDVTTTNNNNNDSATAIAGGAGVE